LRTSFLLGIFLVYFWLVIYENNWIRTNETKSLSAAILQPLADVLQQTARIYNYYKSEL
jgi:hypothetical protein